MFIYPAYAAFFIIYYIFQHEFFLISLICAGDILLLYECSRKLSVGISARVLVAAAAAVVVSGLIYLICRHISNTAE
jgi:hypothetical protein